MIFCLVKSCFSKSMEGKENMTVLLSKCGKQGMIHENTCPVVLIL